MRFLIVVLMALLAVPPASAQDCRPRKVASLDIVGMESGLIKIKILIDGTPRYFLVDTGGIYSTIYSDVADRLELQRIPLDQNVEIYDVVGSLARQYVDVRDVEIGPLRARRIAMIVDHRAAADHALDGTLAPDVLDKFDLDFDVAARKLNLFAPATCDGSPVYWTADFVSIPFDKSLSHIVLPMVLDGRAVGTTIDTGSSTTVLNERIAANLFGIDAASSGMERIPGAAPDDLFQYRYQFKSLSIQGLVIKDPLVYILPDLANEAFHKKHLDKIDLDPIYAARLIVPQLIVGTDVLSRLHLYISYAQSRLYVSQADAH